LAEEPQDAASNATQASGVAAEVSEVLAGLSERPVDEHPDVYEAVHRRLGDTLSDVDHV